MISWGFQAQKGKKEQKPNKKKNKNYVWVLGHRSAGASFPILRTEDKQRSTKMSEWVTVFLCQQLDCLENSCQIPMGDGKMTRLSLIQSWKNTVHLFENVS